MNLKKLFIILNIFLLLGASITACLPPWQIIVLDQSGAQIEITADDVHFYNEKSAEEISTVPLGQLFYHHGYTFIEEITIRSTNKESTTYHWDEVAQDAVISNSGDVYIANQSFATPEISLRTSSRQYENHYSILDIAPSIAIALELPNLPESQGQARVISSGDCNKAVMILLDGLQYEKLITLIKDGTLPFFDQLDMIYPGVTVFPPITTSASAAILTGTSPKITGVYSYGYRSTDVKTLFDLVVEGGKNVIAVEGSSLPFNLRNAEILLSGDKDNDGHSDDNVFSNSMQIIETRMPDLLYIHFHDIDDMGHMYGPDSAEYTMAISSADTYLDQIVQALPPNTLIAIFADHGMHGTENGGNHGTLTAADMVIPIIFIEK